jgi:hypothetical protein
MCAGAIFSFLVVALLSYTLIRTRVRQARNRELNAWIQNQTAVPAFLSGQERQRFERPRGWCWRAGTSACALTRA